MNTRAILAGCVTVSCVPALGLASGGTLVLTPSADTTLFDAAPFNNLGALQSLAVGVTASESIARGILRFDVASQLPANAVVTSATLDLTVVRVGFLVESAEFNLHRVLADWGEGNKGAGQLTGLGAAATSGEATWAERFNPSVFWDAGGGESGTDFESTPSASCEVATGTSIRFETTSSIVADVQGWISQPGSNFGWLIKDSFESGIQTARRLGSREHPSAGPKLTVQYDLSSPVQLVDIANRDGQLCFRFDSKVGKAYVIERRGDAATGDWEAIQTIPAATAEGPVDFCDAIAEGSRFYRVSEL